MSRKGKAGFALRDLVMPVALVLLAGSAAGHYYSRHVKSERESEMSRVTRELFDCEPDELMAKAFTPEKMRAVEKTAAPKEVASAPRRNDPTRGPGFAVKPGAANDRKIAKRDGRPSKTTAAKRQGESARRAARPAGTRNGVAQLPGRAAAVAPMRRPQALADEYDRRCQAIMDEMY